VPARRLSLVGLVSPTLTGYRLEEGQEGGFILPLGPTRGALCHLGCLEPSSGRLQCGSKVRCNSRMLAS